MATSTLKRKASDDDFVRTISDNEADIPQEEERKEDPGAAIPPKKKIKRKGNKGVSSEASAKNTGSGDGTEGIWGRNDDDDGAIDSDFEFMASGDGVVDNFEGWGFDGAKKAIHADNKGIDIDEIVRRRQRETMGSTKPAAEPEAEAEAEAEGQAVSEDEEASGSLDLHDDDDGVLADDTFGMDVNPEDEERMEGVAEAAESDEDEPGFGEEASDNDSVATPVMHPDDNGNGNGDGDDDDASEASNEEDPDEAAKMKQFFAPEEESRTDKAKPTGSFQGMSLSRPILRGLSAAGFTKPTPIQAKTVPVALLGKDVVGGAVTGSGKTAAFVIPILERLLYRPRKVPTSRVIVLAPTRELAIQCHAVATKLAAYTDVKFCLAVGGLSLKAQEAELRLRPDIIIATPGRFIDHMRNSASFSVDAIEILVLDEADRMLEDGFADELNEILTTLPKSRQTMVFSATMTSSVDRLIRAGLNKPVRIMVDAKKKTVGTLVQEFVRLRPGREDKRMGCLLHLCKTVYAERVIVFFKQKKEAHRARIIFALLALSCAELHGSMNQTQRIASVEAFRDGKVSYLLATDLASRGLDIKGVDTVINYEAPQNLEIYVHRVGRTARAGRTGTAVTLAAEPDRKVVKAAVKAGRAQGAKITSRVVDPADADGWQARVDALDDEIEAVAREEKEERQLAQAEMQVRKGENMVRHEDEIKSRPRRTWFETQSEKKQAREAGRAELNGTREKMKARNDGRLSNKDKKRLDAKTERRGGGPVWKKGREDRMADGRSARAKKAAKGRSRGKR